ncbi:sigma-70 family RNA polymerase sigma factor [Actinoplanes sp. NEAU-A12]|uniref:Sigma-70 family RNA polymerase sigma factor n=1 Tax=Actinoplanes sandaracinus TaxID=3045177 RepID=A0ABT6WBB9_9ACTN|nr:sigma-70 family RNA polymerase sigma factor [Actinoplanes sandaracinus]MDI6097004.1 sigma-70 family RNA polymerase sigma factor [Actinoplanes sandaracinus]
MGRPPPLTDPDAFTAFYRAHVDAVLGFVTRRVDDPHLAADITADVFHTVVEAVAVYRPERGGELGWLYGIARNHIAGDARRRAREAARRQRLAGRRLLDDDDIGRLEERIDAAHAARLLYRQVARLPEPERAVVELVAVDGLTVAEAAAALGIRSGTARVRLFRARRALRETHEAALALDPRPVETS